jgi:hypothetical protein
MRTLLFSAASALLMVAQLPGQTPAKASVASAERSEPKASSNRELNTRAYIELLRTDIKKEKSQVMGQIMQLDADQSAKFWPIYKSFETELTGIGDEILNLVQTYISNYYQMTDDTADQLALKLLDIEQKRNQLKKKYYLRVKEGLDAVTAARFLQVENQLERLVDLQIAADLPVMKEQ